MLASSLMGQHRFGEAHDAALELLRSDSTSIAARGMVAEAAMELGRYDEAGRLFGMLATYQADLGTAPRLARWAELRGHPDEGRRLLRQALADATRRHGMPREQVAWFHLRLGDLALRSGHLGEARHELASGLAILPVDYRLLGTLARLHAVRHEWRDATETGELAVSRALDPATLGLLSDAWAAQGDSAKAAEYDRAMALSVLRQPGAYHRAWSLYLLDHGREVPTVLANVRRELETRHDIYGYDLLAWALHRSGRDAEAREPMSRALALGTRDAMLYFHAGMIDRATGDTASARIRLAACPRDQPLVASDAARRGPRRAGLSLPIGPIMSELLAFVHAGLPPYHGSGSAGPHPVPARARGDLSRPRLARIRCG